MGLSTDINLPKSHQAVFPDRCVACGREAPGATVRVCTRAIGWHTLLLWHPGRRFCVEAPVCEWCRDRMRRQRWMRAALEWTVIVCGLAVAWYVLGSFRGPGRRWVALGICLACALPWVLWTMLFPPPLDLTAFKASVDYEFRDPEYAAEFARLNGVELEDQEI